MSFVALEKFDPIHDPEPAPQQQVHVIDFDYVREEIPCSVLIWKNFFELLAQRAPRKNLEHEVAAL